MLFTLNDTLDQCIVTVNGNYWMHAREVCKVLWYSKKCIKSAH